MHTCDTRGARFRAEWMVAIGTAVSPANYNLKKGPMNKKPPVRRILKPTPETRSALQSWHNGADAEIHLYARSLQNAAKTLIGKLEQDQEVDQSARTDWDACPIVLLYREALELHLKALVGEGSNFLKTRTDPISLSQTHSLRWLTQIVCQIIRTVKWESDFTCEGVSSLADFSALVNEVESFDPFTRAIRSAAASSGAKDPKSVSQYYRTFKVVQFAKKLDGLLDLLDATADALAATWDQRTEVSGEEKSHAGGTIKPTIH